jgi:hypothetical protein
MALTPRLTLDNEFISGMKCAICESQELKIVHVDKYPDFVSCTRCGSAFVVEREGSWVMYGNIPEEYPETRQFALKQWTWLDAVAQRAADERAERSSPPATSEPPPPVITDIPPEPTVSSPSALESTPPEQLDSPLRPEEPAPPQPTETPPPFIDDSSAPSLDELFPEEPAPPMEEPQEEMAQMPPFPEDVIILGDESEDIDALREVTPSFMEPGPGPEEVIVPSPFDPIEPPQAIDMDEAEGITEAAAQPFEVEPIEDVTQQVMEEHPEFYVPPTADSVEDTLGARSLELATPTPGTAQPEVPTEAPHPAEEEPTRSLIEKEDKSLSVPIGEPEPDKRYQVTIQGSQPKYPKNYCAHCLRTPVRLKTIMRGSLPDPKQPGKRKMVSLELPFCKDCQKRMDARSQDENNARMIAFLVSAVIAIVAVIIPLVFGIVDFQTDAFLGIILLLVCAVLGFSFPFLLLLSRASNFPPPRDAAFVLSTLLVHDAGPDLTQFEWRNRGYAELFRQVNIENAQGDLERVEDRTTFAEVQPEKITKEPEEALGQEVTSTEPEE